MKVSARIFSYALLLLVSATATAENLMPLDQGSAWGANPHALEPCMNGGVSAFGLYPSQELALAASVSRAGQREGAPTRTTGRTGM